MASLGDERLDAICAVLGVSREELERLEPGLVAHGFPEPIDGAPDQFEKWADGVTDPQRRARLKAIVGILQAAKDRGSA